ncbi:ABC transporter ATP-binding protein [Pseudomonas fluorescens]|uniref:ABC-type dipeptide transporter n=1 Tax=Pseudomonas fluorescens TaxID=294 RepID=A0A1T2Z8H6_PSEFL|nr:ABC transporter ATP-binding protein [Pseudomonas fluorescens]OPB00951.1 ABC transporter ATP-binding protein [Pseudomonas fluorescens]
MTDVLTVNDISIDIPLGDATLRPVRNVTFSVKKGETLCIVGESGCGKSLTSLSIMGLLPSGAKISSGNIILAGQNLNALSEREWSDVRGARISMVFQEPMSSLNPVLTIGEQLTEGFVRHGRGTLAEAEERAISLLTTVRVVTPEARMKQYPHHLSGGLRQRVMIAMALMCKPDVIIADEPTTALDVTVQVQVLKLLKTLQAELGVSVVFVTHDLGVVAHIADRVMVMYGGEVVETGTVEHIFGNPAHPYTQGLLNCLPKPFQRVELGSLPGSVPAVYGEVASCIFSNRCPNVVSTCTERKVDLMPVETGHQSRCILSVEQIHEHSERRA